MNLLQSIYEELLGRDYAPVLFGHLEGQRQSGANDVSAACPFCGKKRKFTYSLIKPIYNCWSCQESGSWVDYLIKQEGLDFGGALRKLADAAGVKLKDYDPEKEKLRQRRASILEAAHQLYRQALLDRTYVHAKEVWEYLTSRGYNKEEIQAMELGCCLGPTLTTGGLKKQGYTDTEIGESGLLTRGFGDTHLLSLLWTDAAGRAVGLVTRSLLSAEELKKRDLQKYKYSRGMRKNAGLLGLPQARQRSEVVLVEGVLDALYLNHHGIPTVATGGTTLAIEQAEALTRAKIRDLLCCLDNDEAGQQATLKLLRELYSAGGLRPYVLVLPEGSKDPDELVRDRGPVAFKRLMQQAVTGGAWLGRWLGEHYDWKQPRSRDSGRDTLASLLSLIAIPEHRDDLALALAEAGGPELKRREIDRLGKRTGAGTIADKFSTGGSRGAGKSRSGLNLYAQRLQDELGCNDTANAARLLKQHKENLRYVHDWGKWLIWDPDCGIWRIDSLEYIQELATVTAEQLRQEAHDTDNPDQQGWLLRHSRNTLSARGKGDMLASARTHPDIAVTTEQLDAQPQLFGVLNGTLELTLPALDGDDGPLRPARREDLITQQAPVTYDPAAECPKFRAHLELVFDGNEQMIAFMLRFLGHCLLHGNPEQQLAIWWGEGANGKSTILNTIKAIMGDYAATLDTEVLMSRSRGGNNQLYELACLRGARLVSASETEQDDTLKASLTKALTGGDEIRAREPYGAPFSFRPGFIPVMATNKKPRIMDSSYGMWRRVLLVPFAVEIPREQWIEDYDKLLIAEEAPGILNLLLDGLSDYLERRAEGKRGLAPPESVLSATSSYREEQDILAEFFADCTEQVPEPEVELHDRVTQPLLWDVYERWCEANARDPLKKRTFNTRVTERFGRYGKSGASGKFWRGVRLSETGSNLSTLPNQGHLYSRRDEP